MNRPRTLLGVFAHPDDESFGPGGTLARYAAQGVQAHVIIATDGDAGSVTESHRRQGGRTLAQERSEELARAAVELGVTSIWNLPYRDSGMRGSADNEHPRALAQQPVERLAAELVDYIRRLKPQVVITHDPYGGYGHPDHIRCCEAVTVAFYAAGQTTGTGPEGAPPSGGGGLPPHTAQKLYYTCFDKRMLRWIVRFMQCDRPQSSPGGGATRTLIWLRSPAGRRRFTRASTSPPILSARNGPAAPMPASTAAARPCCGPCRNRCASVCPGTRATPAPIPPPARTRSRICSTTSSGGIESARRGDVTPLPRKTWATPDCSIVYASRRIPPVEPSWFQIISEETKIEDSYDIQTVDGGCARGLSVCGRFRRGPWPLNSPPTKPTGSPKVRLWTMTSILPPRRSISMAQSKATSSQPPNTSRSAPTGAVEGDLWAAAASIVIQGAVQDDLRAGGQRDRTFGRRRR